MLAVRWYIKMILFSQNLDIQHIFSEKRVDISIHKCSLFTSFVHVRNYWKKSFDRRLLYSLRHNLFLFRIFSLLSKPFMFEKYFTVKMFAFGCAIKSVTCRHAGVIPFRLNDKLTMPFRVTQALSIKCGFTPLN